MNQSLRLPLLKYTQRKKTYVKIIINNNKKQKTSKKKSSIIHPPQEKRGPIQHPRWRSLRQQSRNRSRQLLSQGPPAQRPQVS